MEEENNETQEEVVEVLSEKAAFWQKIAEVRSANIKTYEENIEVEKVFRDAAQLQFEILKNETLK